MSLDLDRLEHSYQPKHLHSSLPSHILCPVCILKPPWTVDSYSLQKSRNPRNSDSALSKLRRQLLNPTSIQSPARLQALMSPTQVIASDAGNVKQKVQKGVPTVGSPTPDCRRTEERIAVRGGGLGWGFATFRRQGMTGSRLEPLIACEIRAG